MNARAVVLGFLLVASACTANPNASSAGDSSTTTSLPVSTTTATSATTTTSPTTTTTAAPTTTTTTLAELELPPGYTSSPLGESGLQMGLPDSFVPIDLSDDEALQLFRDGASELDSDLLDDLTEAIGSSQVDILFWAFDFENGSAAFVPTFNVLCLPSGPLDQVEVYEAVMQSQLESFGFLDVTVERLDTSAGPGVLIDSFAPEELGSYASLQLVVPFDEKSCTMSFAYIDGDDAYAEALEISLSTLAVFDSSLLESLVPSDGL